MTGILTACPSSEWIDSKFHRRPIPDGCVLVSRRDVSRLSGIARERAESVVCRHPMVRKIIVRTDNQI